MEHLLAERFLWALWGSNDCLLIQWNILEDHLYIKRPALTPCFADPELYTFHASKPVYKDHLTIRTTLCWPLGLSLYICFTVF